MKKNNEFSISDRTPYSREASRSIEWTFFENIENIGQWNTDYRQAKCKSCSKVLRSKRETMHNHVKSCTNISLSARNLYLMNKHAFHNNNTNATKSSTCSIKEFYQPKVGKKFASKIETQMIRAAIATNTSFHALTNPEFIELFRLLNPSFVAPGKTALRTSIFERVWNQERKHIQSAYQTGSYISLSVDGWTTPGHLKWLEICGIMRSVKSGSTMLDARRFEDVTLEGENARVVCREMKQEIFDVLELIDSTGNKSVLGSVISDSVQGNISAKAKLFDMFPEIIFLPCHPHQLNLLAGNFLTH